MVLLPAQMATGLYAVLGLSGLCLLEFKRMKDATVAHVAHRRHLAATHVKKIHRDSLAGHRELVIAFCGPPTSAALLQIQHSCSLGASVPLTY